MNTKTVIVRWKNLQSYDASWKAMREFTDSRDDSTPDEIWFLEHMPVFTQGQNGKAEHVLNPGNIPVVQTDRGGQITYHGPGQLMIYTLIDLKRKGLNIRQLVSQLEKSVIDLLAQHSIASYAKCEAPGVYIKDNGAKICSIGLRIRRGCAYHGIALNVNMDLSPFSNINPCGFSGLKMAQIADYRKEQNTLTTARQLINYLMQNLGYTTANFVDKQLVQDDGK